MKGYQGIFLDQETQELLVDLQERGLSDVVKNMHITFHYGALEKLPDELMGRDITFKIVGYASDGKNSGFQVELPEELLQYYKSKNGPHITVSIGEIDGVKGKPVDTGTMQFKPLEEPIEINGRFGNFIHQLGVIFDNYDFERIKNGGKKMNLLEFLNSEESKKIMENLTIVERVKFATAFQWAGKEKPTPKQAEIKAKSKCTEEDVKNRNEEGNTRFESELASVEAIKKLVGLTDEEAQLLEEQIFTQTHVSEDLAQKIKNAIEDKGTEESIVEILGHVHNNWMRNHGDNFQKEGRDKDYQFVDLRLMSFGDDGATADLLFLRPILEACEIKIDMEKLEQKFNEQQVEFLRENGITSKEQLINYLTKGSAENETLKGIVAGDGTGRTIYEILAESPEVVNHMAEQVMQKIPVKLEEHDLAQIAEVAEGTSLEAYNNVVEETKCAEGRDINLADKPSHDIE